MEGSIHLVYDSDDAALDKDYDACFKEGMRCLKICHYAYLDVGAKVGNAFRDGLKLK